MKKFIAGLVLGLLITGTPSIAEWSPWTDRDLLREVVGHFATANVQLKRMADAQEWQARSLQRLVWVAEREFPPPPEKKH